MLCNKMGTVPPNEEQKYNSSNILGMTRVNNWSAGLIISETGLEKQW